MSADELVFDDALEHGRRADTVHRGSAVANGGIGAADTAWRWLVVAALLVVSGVVAAPPSSTTDGLNLVPSLDRPPSLAWTVPTTALSGGARMDAHVMGSMLAVVTNEDATGYAIASGERRWHVPLDRARCTYQGTIVCVSGRQDESVVVTIDPASGAVYRLPLPGAIWALRDGDDVYALLYSRHLQEVVRVGPGGRVLWHTPVPYRPDIIGVSTGYPFARIENRLYVGAIGPAILDLTSGEALQRPLALRYDTSGIFGFSFDGAFWHLWSGEQVALPTTAARLTVDDEVLGGPSVLVSPASGVTEVWEGEAEPIWAGVGGETPFARLDGVLVTDDDRNGETHGIDLRTGAQLWSTGRTACPCVGAGSVLLLSGSPAVPAGLTAIDVHTGMPVWQLAFDPATHLVDLVDGGVLVADTAQLSFYEW